MSSMGEERNISRMRFGMTAGVFTKELSDFENEIRQLKDIGFDCIDYQGFINTQTPLYEMSETDFETYLQNQRQITESAGIQISQAHGPWRYPICDSTEEERNERFEKMSKAIRGTAILGCDRMVLHNIMPQGKVDENASLVKALNRDFFLRLCEVGRENGVVICLENMPFSGQCLARPWQTLDFVKSFDSKWFRVCLDTGHCAVLGISAGDAVRLIGKEYLWALHVHDNDGIKDLHRAPCDGVLDWADFGDALAQIGFEGTLSLETVVPKTLDEEGRQVMLRDLYRQAEQIANRTWSKKSLF